MLKTTETNMNPIQKLMAEHKVILRGIDLLEQGADRLEKGENIPVNYFLISIDFIRNYADKYHHAKEEDILFVRLEQLGFSPKMGPVAVMLNEHIQGRNFISGLESATNKYADGDKTAIQDIIENARNYAILLRQHIQKEDMILYPMAQNALGEVGIERMQSDFNKVESEQSGIESKYLVILESLEPK
jgi:hemerythrin-like domain-containing protein